MEILQNEKSKEEKKQIPEVTDDFLESAIKSSKLIEELILQTSYASVSLISSEKKFENATEKSLCPSVIAPDPFARALFAQELMEIPAALFCEEVKFSASDVIKESPNLSQDFVCAFQGIKSRPFDDENGFRECVVKLLKKGGLASATLSVEKDHKIGRYRADVAFCLTDFCNYLVGVVETKLPHGEDDLVFQGFAHLKYDRDNKKKELIGDWEAGDDAAGDWALKKTLAKLHPSLVLAWRGLEVDIYGVIFLHTKQRGKEPGIAYSHLAHFSLAHPFAAYTMVEWLKAKLQKLQESPPSEFPATKIYEGTGKEKIELTYTDHIRDNVFKATIKGGEECCIVKFIGDRYGQEVHKHCCKGGFAPALYSCEYLPEVRHWMVVMHCDDEFHTLHNALKDHDALEDKENKIPKSEEVKKNLEEAVKWIHKGGFVHGDLRPPNILVNKAGEVHIIDFDWAGKQKVVSYPRFLNGGVRWPNGAVFGGPILKKHDLFFLQKILEKLS